jgi:hypothetical protein
LYYSNGKYKLLGIAIAIVGDEKNALGIGVFSFKIDKNLLN